ncbi:MAG: 50S ribosomal protein L28 [Dehalococcoidia bacterium]|nr:50S ribosomal protein L28 [Dehalococcoidia bacterium]
MTLSGKCDICGKKIQFGRNVSHSKRRTNRTWLPNVHRVKVATENCKTHLNICTRCLRTQHKLRG